MSGGRIFLTTFGILILCVFMGLIHPTLPWLVLLGTSIWAGLDASAINLKKYNVGGPTGPFVTFFGCLLFWVLTFPWYLVNKSKIAKGEAILKPQYAEPTPTSPPALPTSPTSLTTHTTSLFESSAKSGSSRPEPGKSITNQENAAYVDTQKVTQSLNLDTPPPFPNYDTYAEYTRTRNWGALCALNSVELDSFGTKKELKVLPNYLEDGEVIFALTSGLMKQSSTSNESDRGLNTWLVVLTNERFLFLDHALLTKSVDTQSIRHERVQAVSSSQGWFLGKIIVDIGARTVVIDNCRKATVAPMARLANKWLAVMQKGKQEPSKAGVKATNSVLDEIKKLAELHSIGVLTDEEFTSAKAKLLNLM